MANERLDSFDLHAPRVAAEIGRLKLSFLDLRKTPGLV
jgi:hypothetical protein